jgi:hypothetical protein
MPALIKIKPEARSGDKRAKMRAARRAAWFDGFSQASWKTYSFAHVNQSDKASRSTAVASASSQQRPSLEDISIAEAL